MDMTKFETFRQICNRRLPDEIDKILDAAKGEKACTIGFITTDDFYGFYLAWDCSGKKIGRASCRERVCVYV